MAAGGACSLRVPARRALFRIAWECWAADSPDVQAASLLILDGFSRRYRRWILDGLLEKPCVDPGVRAQAQRLREALG